MFLVRNLRVQVRLKNLMDEWFLLMFDADIKLYIKFWFQKKYIHSYSNKLENNKMILSVLINVVRIVQLVVVVLFGVGNIVGFTITPMIRRTISTTTNNINNINNNNNNLLTSCTKTQHRTPLQQNYNRYSHHIQHVLSTIIVDDVIDPDTDRSIDYSANDNNDIPVDYDNDDNDNNAATLRAVTFCNLLKDQEPDVLCDYLIEIGACSACVIDADRGTNIEQPIFLEPGIHPYYEIQQQPNTPVEITPIWNRCNVTAHFPSSIDLDFVVELLQESNFFTTTPSSTTTTVDTDTDNTNTNQQRPSSIIHSIERVPNKDWIIHVQQEWKPIIVSNRFLLRFPWHNDTIVQSIINDHYNSSSTSNSSLLVPLKLQGGIAFGTGEHATTQLCLQWLGTILDDIKATSPSSSSSSSTTSSSSSTFNQQQQLSLIDYGSGSGILGLGAYAYGQQINITVNCIGIDLDIDACRIANENSIINNIPMKNYLPSLVVSTTTISTTIDNDDNEDNEDNESKSLLLKASTKIKSDTEQIQLESLTNQYDICVANILAGPLISLASTLASVTKRNGGKLGLSGILSHQAQTIIDAYTTAGFRSVQVSNQIGDWILITGIRS